ncbi:sensor histidine kinase [Xylophilus sp. Leaf220]|uniref:sensor histidine kinase n=1 Tax=Xylophilus sp. Leaf220 TaxID=1735686 RepID=UPI0006FB75B5|nr:sensor histidine kinase [Xylophilus sp. Leaf220]KQM80128.1 histidine kinase [Xylophilus sp. Leaf220]
MSGPAAAAGAAAASKPARPSSLRRRLLLGILLPVVVLIGFNTAGLYRRAQDAADTAYDRTLLASAKSISEQLDVRGYDEAAELRATVPYSALEAFEADNESRLFYRVSDLRGRVVSGFPELPFWRGTIPDRPPYAALVTFYDDRFRGQDVRVAVLLQPVASAEGRTMAVIQVAETLELRHALARTVLQDTLQGQAGLVAVIVLVVLLAVQHATRPVRRLSAALEARPEGELTPLAAPDAPRELLPLVDATNAVMERLRHLLEHQRRFMRDAAHQLRTPLAVLKVQTQSALRGDLPALQALREIEHTVDRATALANQMLSLAKVEQWRGDSAAPRTDLSAVVREVALDLSPLVADKELDFSVMAPPMPVRAEDWMLRELVRNLLHNAIRHTPAGGALAVTVAHDGTVAVLTIADSGPGLAPALRGRLFQPFASVGDHGGSGLGLAICQEIVRVLQGSIALEDRAHLSRDASAALPRAAGLDATVRLPLAPPVGIE